MKEHGRGISRRNESNESRLTFRNYSVLILS